MATKQFGLVVRGGGAVQVAKAHRAISVLNKAETIMVADESSSMSWLGGMMPEAQARMLESIDASAPGMMKMTVYGAGGSGKDCIVRHSDGVPPREAYVYDAARMHTGPNGQLRFGSPLRDGLGHGLDKALSLRKVHHCAAPIMVIGLFDGADTTSALLGSDIQRKLKLARASEIAVRIVFFLQRNNAQYASAFVADCGLEDDEWTVYSYEDQTNAQKQLKASVDDLSGSVRGTVRGW